MVAQLSANGKDQLLAHFKAAGFDHVSPAILQPADIFLDLAGEELRRRLFLTAGRDGAELCLRPDFTIPVCRQHMATGAADRVAGYAYLGPVFRQRMAAAGEFPQAGIEWIGRTDLNEADADTMALARDTLAVLGLTSPEIVIGDIGLFTGLLDALNLAPAWRRRLRDSLDDPARMEFWLARMEAGPEDDQQFPGISAALQNDDPQTASGLVRDFMEIAGLSAVGGRSADEIAERFVEQVELSAGGSEVRAAAQTIRAFLSVSGEPLAAIAQITQQAQQAGLDLTAASDRFRQRLDLLKAAGFDIDGLRFRADFGRRLGYYTGFVFEMRAGDTGNDDPVLGGGRYDGLMTLLGAQSGVPAVGFSIWIDRLGDLT